MRALLICHSAAYETLGGGEKSLLTIASRWRELHPAWELTFIVPAADGKLAPAVRNLGFECIAVASFPWLMRELPTDGARVLRYQRQNAKAVTQLVSLIKSRKFDLVVTNTIVNPWGAVAAKMTATPHAWLVREFGDLDHKLKFQFGAEQTWRDINLLSDLVVANSGAVRDHIEENAPGTKAFVSYPPVKIPSDERPDPRDVADKSVPLKVLCLGTMSESKGQATAIEAAALLLRSGRPVSLTLVGAEAPKGYRTQLSRLASELNVSEHVRFLDSVTQVEDLITDADIGLTPSLMEAFGRVTLEYMLQGKPVVGARSGGTRELVDQGQTGFLFDPTSAEGLAAGLAAYDDARELVEVHGAAGLAKARALIQGERSLDSLLAKFVDLPAHPKPSTRLPALLVSQMADAGDSLTWLQEGEAQATRSTNYRVGQMILGPVRRLARIGGYSRRLLTMRSGETVSSASSRPRAAASTGSRPAAPAQTRGLRRVKDQIKTVVVALSLRSRGLVDRKYYQAQAGRSFLTVTGASLHFVRIGILRGLAPSVRFEPEWAAAVSGRTAQQATRYAAWQGPSGLSRVFTSVMHSDSTILMPNPSADPKNILAPFHKPSEGYRDPADFFSSDQRLDDGPLTRVPSNDISLTDWRSLRDHATRRDAGLVSILMLTYNDWRKTIAAVDAVLNGSADHRIEIVLVDNGSHPFVRRILRALYSDTPSVSIVALPRNLNFAAGNNVAFGLSHGGRVVFLNNDTEVSPGWLPPLLTPLLSSQVLGVQPLLIYGHGTIQTAGTIFNTPTTLPRHFLTDHPVEDVLTLPPGALVGLNAVTGACLAMRAVDFAAVDGFDELFVNGMEDVDLCLRMVNELNGTFSVAIDSRVMHYESVSEGRGRRTLQNRTRFWRRWAGALPESDDWRFDGLGMTTSGFEPHDHKRGESGLVYGSTPRSVRLVDSEVGARARVAIRLPFVDGGHPLARPDSSLVVQLTQTLRDVGVLVIVDSPTTRIRRSRVLDDVIIHFSSDDSPNIQPGAMNIVVRTGSLRTSFQFQHFGDLSVLADEVTTDAGGLEYQLSAVAMESILELVRNLVSTNVQLVRPAPSAVLRNS